MSTVVTPIELKQNNPSSIEVINFIKDTREQIKNILNGHDDRIIIIVGPCSIHNPSEAIDYAKKLKVVSDKHQDTLLILMRTYFEKPRTSIGWKGLLNDPELNNQKNINLGLEEARKLLISLNQIGIPCATEFLDILVPNYYSDLISWGCIGARTTESQSHRQMASGLKMPIGFKNGTLGSFKIAVDAILAVQHQHSYLDINQNGLVKINQTSGNPNCHIVLRGGWDGPTIKPNYHVEDLQHVAQLLQYSNLKQNIVIDCSHGNSKKDYRNQTHVVDYLAEQISKGNSNIIGVMLESNHHEGNQKLDHSCPEKLKYGVSVTDGCISFETTEDVIEVLSVAIRNRRIWYTN